MVMTKREDVTKQGSCKILWRKLCLRGSLLLVLIQFLGGGVGVVAYLSLSGSGREVGWGGRLLTFSAFRMGAYSRRALIWGWALIQINTVCALNTVHVTSMDDIACHFIIFLICFSGLETKVCLLWIVGKLWLYWTNKLWMLTTILR